MADIKALPTNRAGWGDDEDFDGLIKTQQILIDAITGMGLAPVLHQVDAMGGKHDPARPLYNIIVDLRGTTLADEMYIFGAHFDAVPNSPGADDNATGVACLLEALRLLKDHPRERTLRVIFFNLEEMGLVGSRQYAPSLEPDIKAGRLKVRGMVSLDMLGYYSDEPGSQKSPIDEVPGFEPPTVGNFIGMGGIFKNRRFSQRLDAEMRRASPELKTVVVDFLPIAPPDLLRSDHAPFLAIGVPAVILSDTANFRNPHYHTSTDTIDTIDPQRFAIACRGIIGAMHRLAGPVKNAAETPDAAPPEKPQPPPDAPAGSP
jgi:Zn-dependent M28 family amino/carboxypeptidase